MRKLSGRTVVILLVGLAANISSVNAAPTVSPEVKPQTERGGVPAATGRLKFKGAGPVCLCGNGMSERDIEQALAKLNREQRQGSTAGSGQAGNQETNNNLGVAK